MVDDVLAKSMNTQKFSVEIDKLVKKLNVSYFDAIIYYCEKNSIEVESVASLVKSNLRMKARLQTEAEDLHFLPKRAKLPV
jgi:hypothetical protein